MLLQLVSEATAGFKPLPLGWWIKCFTTELLFLSLTIIHYIASSSSWTQTLTLEMMSRVFYYCASAPFLHHYTLLICYVVTASLRGNSWIQTLALGMMNQVLYHWATASFLHYNALYRQQQQLNSNPSPYDDESSVLALCWCCCPSL